MIYIFFNFQTQHITSQECQKLREENLKLTFQAKSKMDIKQHEQEIRTMINNNKQLTEQLGMQSFTFLIADLCQDINILSSYSMYPNGIFP